MKLIKLLCPLLIAMLLLSSCNTVQPGGGQSSLEGTPIESPSDTTPPELTEPLTKEEMLKLVPDKQNLPSYDDLCKIKEGMRIEEVYPILGNPQRTEIRKVPFPSSNPYVSWVPHMNTKVYVYECSDDRYLAVAFWRTQTDVVDRVGYLILIEQ
jgi:hypothetical protein